MNRYSIKAISAIVLFILGGLNILIISLFTYHILRENVESRYYERAVILLEETTSHLHRQMNNAETLVSYIARQADTGRLSENPTFHQDLFSMVQITPTVESLIYAENNGPMFSTRDVVFPESYKPEARPWYILAQKSNGSPIWSEPFLDYINQEIIFAVSMPFSQTVEGVVAAVFKVADISNSLKYEWLGVDGYMMILTAEGTVIANRDGYFIGNMPFTDKLKEWVINDEIYRFDYPLSGNDYTVFAAEIPINGMYVVTAVSRTEIAAHIRSELSSILLIETGLLLGFTFMIYLLWRKLLIPLERLSQLMREAKKGDYTVKAEFSTYYEIQQLSNQFNKMVEAIRTRDEILKNREIEIKNLAYYDPLTGLPNRTYLQKTLKRVLKNEEALGALLFIDLDGFKIVNDTAGHSTGDLVLKEVSARLRHNLRYHQFAARIGGDEFIIILQDVDSMDVISRVAGRILSLLNQPILLGQTHYDIGASIGIAVYPLHGSSPEPLLKKADMAMYKAKRSGKNNYQFFEENLEEEIIRHNSIEKGIRRAVKENQFFLHYQPQFDMKTGMICGLEALLRHKEEKLSGFGIEEIIVTAEETGLIVEIERNVYFEAFGFLKKLNNEMNGSLTMSINVSSQHLMQSDFMEHLIELVAETGVDRHLLDLEITETAIMESVDAGKQRLQQLKDSGFNISMDDFGTGYSSLSYLQNLPIDCVKIDKSFIESMENDQRKRNIISLIIELVHNLGLKIIAEGIENVEQHHLLASSNCNIGQGFFLSKPLPGTEILKLLENRIVL